MFISGPPIPVHFRKNFDIKEKKSKYFDYLWLLKENFICQHRRRCPQDLLVVGHLIIPKEGIENARVDLGGSQMKKMGKEEAIIRNRQTKRDLPEKATVRLREEGGTR